MNNDVIPYMGGPLSRRKNRARQTILRKLLLISNSLGIFNICFSRVQSSSFQAKNPYDQAKPVKIAPNKTHVF